MPKYHIKSEEIDYGTTYTIGREISTRLSKTVLRLEFDESNEVIGALWHFKGNTVSTSSEETIKELKHLKALLNSFEEL